MTEPTADLSTPEGVNEGSAKSTGEGDEPQGDVRAGGHPERAAEQPDPRDDPIIDAPFTPRDPSAPSLEQSVEEGAR